MASYALELGSRVSAVKPHSFNHTNYYHWDILTMFGPNSQVEGCPRLTPCNEGGGSALAYRASDWTLARPEYSPDDHLIRATGPEAECMLTSLERRSGLRELHSGDGLPGTQVVVSQASSLERYEDHRNPPEDHKQ